tara:strand:+ start:385 stop:1137 length:753 start_codon:yes stop_codon:yes gene_type:complete
MGVKDFMTKFPLNLIIFSTTMGHGGEHTYSNVIESLFDQFDPRLFSNKILHLKTREGEESIADSIKSLCSNKNIRVIESKESIVHHSENHLSHSAGYFKDIYKAYSDLEVREQKYSLWLEDDWIIQSKTPIRNLIEEALDFLDKNPNQLCVRFNRGDGFNEPDGDFHKETDNIFTQAINYTKYGPTFTFQPNISRTSEIFLAWKTAQNYLDKLGSYHCELMSGDLLKPMSNSNTPFSFFNPSKVYSEHIG